ncbi:bifunctional diaminohydroxyphosphoribosylaminopyrimidine deaminase/5-amino-6-(5-phosphoribosylamino)uracil reductase RibD [Lapillicoccus jejuensis]|uniref:Riboflavin biosynthesis protein RibD n=1 Tax=Lapillicoccus jejuensis TaxID=402171 RepID=A0A542E6F2_9MICO|nr:bifunctional diaminohydroxyphosphoribosylaminopyrimidine deaminase/5-amino-6-(5-phosphoribosylamino)uracil reductase RibD [Lapillicoccus jejuensis]TQJ10907.1 diaminohydroxyphosphoribosylaminopyrimidine deaminase/5-amino-6-(5-phosphoribosylamino)uracil reductase [Lapillicoccus jejuensis]
MVDEDQHDQQQDERYLREALELAARGPLPDPNPRVGCVLLDAAGAVVGRGFHAGAGTAHAEVVALADAAARGADVRGGTAYVSLEPCAHTGRTGPCAQALLDAGVARVVHAQSDPDPVAAGGADLLRAAGVPVDSGVLADEAEALNAVWTRSVRLGRPVVTWKVAASLDGRSAAADRTSRWVTGAAARADVHDLRARCDAVVVGTGTALADDPSLTTRWPDGSLRDRQPLRVVVGDRDLPSRAAVLDAAAPTLVVRGHDPAAVLETLHGKGIRHVLLEGGPTLAAAFLAAGLVDEVVAYVAPVLLGAGPSAVGDLGITTITDALRLEPTDVTVVGVDVRVTARPRATTPQKEIV